MNLTPPSKRPKQTKAAKGAGAAAIKKAHSAAKVPGMSMKVKPGKAADRYKDIYFPSTMDKRRKEWAKKGTAPKLPPIGGSKGKKK